VKHTFANGHYFDDLCQRCGHYWARHRFDAPHKCNDYTGSAETEIVYCECPAFVAPESAAAPHDSGGE
jgi:hypothetical protein